MNHSEQKQTTTERARKAEKLTKWLPSGNIGSPNLKHGVSYSEVVSWFISPAMSKALVLMKSRDRLILWVASLGSCWCGSEAIENQEMSILAILQTIELTGKTIKLKIRLFFSIQMFQIMALEVRSQGVRIWEINDGIQEVQSLSIEGRHVCTF